MIKYNFDEVKNADKLAYEGYNISKLEKLPKAIQNIADKIAEVDLNDRYSYAIFTLLKIKNEYAIAWNLAGGDDNHSNLMLLYHKASKSLVTFNDIRKVINDKDFKDNFPKICKKNGWTLLSYDDENKKNHKKELKGKIDFDVNAVDELWRAANYDHKQLTPDEKKQIVDGCHKLLDVFASKDDGSEIGLYIYSELLKLLKLD